MCQQESVLCLHGVFMEGRASTEPFNAIMDSIGLCNKQLISLSNRKEAKSWQTALNDGLGAHKAVLATLIAESSDEHKNDFDTAAPMSIAQVDRIVDASNFKRLTVAVKTILRVISESQPVVWILEELQFPTVCAMKMIQSVLSDDF